MALIKISTDDQDSLLKLCLSQGVSLIIVFDETTRICNRNNIKLKCKKKKKIFTANRHILVPNSICFASYERISDQRIRISTRDVCICVKAI